MARRFSVSPLLNGETMENLRIYRITDHYVRYLNGTDSRVQYNKNAKRPYVGVVFTFGKFKHFVRFQKAGAGVQALRSKPQVKIKMIHTHSLASRRGFFVCGTTGGYLQNNRGYLRKFCRNEE